MLHSIRGLCVRFLLENSRFNVLYRINAALNDPHGETYLERNKT